MLTPDTLYTLIRLLADGQFHSGTELANVLSISRTAIWKHLQSFSLLGLDYSAVSGRGYRLGQPLELLDADLITAHLDAMGKPLPGALEIHASVSSTNSYLMAKARHHTPSGSACLAEYQTAGRGRLGRTWISPFGHNIYLSILWRFRQKSITELSGLSLAVGVAVIRALRNMGVYDAQLKWPNDIYWQGKKLGGILIEVSSEVTGPCFAIIGLGLNLLMSAKDASQIDQPWTDLSQILGYPISRNQFVAYLLANIITIISDFESFSLQPLLVEWQQYDCLANRPVVLYVGNHVIEGTVLGINDHGHLLLKKHDGSLTTFASGEVSFKTLNGKQHESAD